MEQVTVPGYDPRRWAVELISATGQCPDVQARFEASAEVSTAFASLIETVFRAHEGQPPANSVIMAFAAMWSLGYDAGLAAAKGGQA